MKTIRAFKAQPIVAARPVESLTIVIDEAIPDRTRIHDALAAAQEVFATDAYALARALRAALPGGTLDALTAELLKMKATSLVVPRDAL
jgi:hypothetical protein